MREHASIILNVISFFSDDRRLLSHEPVAAKHCPDHHLRGSPSADGRDRVRRFLEVSKSPSPPFSRVLANGIHARRTTRHVKARTRSSQCRWSVLAVKRQFHLRQDVVRCSRSEVVQVVTVSQGFERPSEVLTNRGKRKGRTGEEG